MNNNKLETNNTQIETGECIKALYREDIGYVDIVWGVGGKSGYGLCHIIEQHEDELKQLGFNSPFLILSATVTSAGVESVLLTGLFPIKRICAAKIQTFFYRAASFFKIF